MLRAGTLRHAHQRRALLHFLRYLCTPDPYCNGQYYEVGDLSSLLLAINRTIAHPGEKRCIQLTSDEILINNGSNITLDGNGATVIKGTGESRLFRVENATLNLVGITVKNGFDYNGGGCIAVNNGILNMHASVISHCGTLSHCVRICS